MRLTSMNHAGLVCSVPIRIKYIHRKHSVKQLLYFSYRNFSRYEKLLSLGSLHRLKNVF